MDSHEVEDKTRGFVAACDAELDHVGLGCFVLVGSGEAAYWVEVCRIDGDRYTGIVHPELALALCPIAHDFCEIASFRRAQITALGCDRYCRC
jgi:hypothetical protein